MRVVARDRPVIPKAPGGMANGSIDLLTAIQGEAQYEMEMVNWLSEIRLLADPTLSPKGSIMDGASFDAFWRTLLYNNEPHSNHSPVNQQPDQGLGISFGYWYLLKKLCMKGWQNDIFAYLLHYTILKNLSLPFEEAEGMVRLARNFFVSEHGRIGWVPLRTLAGDRVCVFQGMRIPVILRSHGDRWEIIGACYVHELMDGEVWDLDGLEWNFLSFV